MKLTKEITKLYVLEEKNGEKHFFESIFDRNWFFNRLETWEQFYSKSYDIDLTDKTTFDMMLLQEERR